MPSKSVYFVSLGCPKNRVDTEVMLGLADRQGLRITSSPGTSFRRSATSRAGNLVARTVTGLKGVRDATTSFRVVDPDVAWLVPPTEAQAEVSCYFASLTALAQAQGFAIDEVPIQFRPRYSGVSGLTVADGRRFWRGLRATRRGTRLPSPGLEPVPLDG